MKQIIDITTGEITDIDDDSFKSLLINGMIFYKDDEGEYFYHTIFRDRIIDTIDRNAIKRFNDYFNE